MITDKLENAKLYYSLGGRIEKALKYLETTNIADAEEGKYEIDGENIFAVVSVYETKDSSNCNLEAHRKYIDVQYAVRGSELIGYAPLNSQAVIKEYDEEKDFALYGGTPSFIKLEEKMFAIFYPGDLHMPGIKVSESAHVKKVVIKVKL
ncbi:MAG: YhcH/YjgK/YiaL family protein [Ignavibacteria bacterium]|nr:YhcH/YjgK/YiaL family protein [Ignavibacteria bacterium]